MGPGTEHVDGTKQPMSTNNVIRINSERNVETCSAGGTILYSRIIMEVVYICLCLRGVGAGYLTPPQPPTLSTKPNRRKYSNLGSLVSFHFSRCQRDWYAPDLDVQ